MHRSLSLPKFVSIPAIVSTIPIDAPIYPDPISVFDHDKKFVTDFDEINHSIFSSILLRVKRNADDPDEKSKPLTQNSLHRSSNKEIARKTTQRSIDSTHDYIENDRKPTEETNSHYEVLLNIDSPVNLRKPLLDEDMRSVVADSNHESVDSKEDPSTQLNHPEYKTIPHSANCFKGRNLFIGLLTLSLFYNATNEMVDGFSSVEGKVHLFPFPGDPESLALIPNSALLQISVIAMLAANTLSFDYERLSHGFNEVLNAITTWSLPQSWKDLWRKNNLSYTKLKLLVGCCLLISAFSTGNEIISSFSMIDDNTEDQPFEEEDRIAPWLKWATSSALVDRLSALLGNLAFLFCEAFKFPEVVVKIFGKQRGMKMAPEIALKLFGKPHGVEEFKVSDTPDQVLVPYPWSYELITLPTRFAGLTGTALFALIAAMDVLKDIINLNPYENKIAWAVAINTHKSMTWWGYEGEYHIEILSRLFNTIREIKNGIFPSMKEILASMIATLTVTLAGGTPAYIQQKLIENYFDDLGGTDFIKDNILAPLTLLYAIQIWVNYSGSLYDPLNNLFNWIGNRFSFSFSSDRSFSGDRQNDDEKEDAPAFTRLNDKDIEAEQSSLESEQSDIENPRPINDLHKMPEKSATRTSRIGQLGHWLAEKATVLRKKLCGSRPSEAHEDKQKSKPTDTNTKKIEKINKNSQNKKFDIILCIQNETKPTKERKLGRSSLCTLRPACIRNKSRERNLTHKNCSFGLTFFKSNIISKNGPLIKGPETQPESNRYSVSSGSAVYNRKMLQKEKNENSLIPSLRT